MRLAISNRIIVKKSQEIKRGQQETLFVFEEQTICIKDNSRSKVFAVEVRAINKHASGHISVVFSVRTFDYENDACIQSLFNEEEQEKRDSSWSEINVGSLTDDEVKQIIGSYPVAIHAQRALLRIRKILLQILSLT